MTVQIEALEIPEVLLITPKRISDKRGFFSETFRSSWLQDLGFKRQFVQENHSLSIAQGVLRGLHFQTGTMAQDKLVRCIRGRILDVAVDIRTGSPTYGRYVIAELEAEIGNQLLVPIGFAHGFLTLEANSEVLYKTTEYYSADHDQGIAWDDPEIKVDWQLADASPVLSEKDKRQQYLSGSPSYFSYSGPGYSCVVGGEK